MTTTTLLGRAALLAWLTIGAPALAQTTFITIGSGGVTGVYYPAALAICGLINAERATHGVRCTVEASGGSTDNIDALRAGEIDFGVAQSDAQAAAVAGSRAFEDSPPYDALRAVFAMHAEPVHVLARADSGVDSVADLRGKRVNIGNPGSGARVLAEIALDAAGLAPDDLALAAEMRSSEQPAALCDGRVDVAIWAAGPPNGAAMEAAETCDIALVGLDEAEIAAALAVDPSFAAVTIPGGTYPGTADDIASWGPKATLVVDAATPDEIVYTLVKAVFEGFETFKAEHPALADLTAEDMIREGLTAPLHPGAARYYAERGWM
jgi:TRAP transporter TAXI family solute receptor